MSASQSPESEIFEVLQNSRRRLVIEYLMTSDGTASVNELADHVASIENDVPPEQLTAKQRKRVYVSLHQFHLPKLHEMNIVDLHEEGTEVARGSRATEAEHYLESDGGPSRNWALYYGGLGVVGTVVVVLYWLNVPPFAAVSPMLLTLGIVVAVMALVGLHLISVDDARLPP